MRTTICDEGIRETRLLGRTRLVRWDEVESLEGHAAIARGRRILLDAPAADAVRAALDGPRAAELAAARAEWEGWLARPRGARRTALALLAAADRLAATDVHLEPGPGATLARIRLEGELVPLCALAPDEARAVGAALKGLAGCLPYRADLVQEGRIPREETRGDVRASFVPTAYGERVALRLFGRLHALEELGLDQATLSALRAALDAPRGLLLVAGPSGGGKTTTLYACLDHLSRVRAGAHLSLEDPVEQRLRARGIAVDQVELEPARGLDGEAALAAALRQDVDVLAVGEIRTPSEARLAVHAAHTGRLVLAGVHAGDAEEARTRLLDLGVEPALVATTLRAVLHQRLVAEPCAPCPACHGIGRVRRLQASLHGAMRRAAA